MSNVQISTPFNISLEFEIAPFFKRLIAYFLDFIILLGYMFFLKYFIFIITDVSFTSAYALDIVLICIPLLTYNLVCEVLFHGQSAGKKAMGIRVLSLEGGDANLSQYLLRWMFRIWEWPLFFSVLLPDAYFFLKVFLFVMGGITVIIIIAVTANNQRLGDLAANTVIVSTRIKSSIHDTVFMEITQKDYVVRFPQVLKLSDRDINTIKTVLNDTYKRNNFETAHRIAGRIKAVLQIETDMEVDMFLQQLIADYNYLATKE
jgi:uncharacterized RDD family membrane protein YckC